MTTFVVLSDTHGRRGAVDKVRALFAENDYIVHLGDGAGDMRETAREYPEKTYVLHGNCDFSAALEECVIETGDGSVFCCHGHRYGVKSGRERLAARARELGCEVALYGHTHEAKTEEIGGVLCVCPGALGAYADPSYCYLVLHRGKATPTLVSVAGK